MSSVEITNNINSVTISDTVSIIDTTDVVSVVQVSGAVGPQGPAGTGGALGYYGAFHDETDQYVATINTPTTIILSHTDEANGVSINNDSHIVFDNAGTYDIQFSAQLAYTDVVSAELVADIWIQLNGVDVPESTGRVTLTVNGTYTIAAWDYMLSVDAGDYIEFVWSTTNTNIVLTRETANAVHPGVPSMAVSVMQVMYTQVGPTGVQGLTGIQGLQGRQGIQGLQGTTGAQGVQGATGTQGTTVYTLTYAGTITPNAANGSIQTVTLTGDVTINAFTTPISGQTVTIILTQDGTGSRLLTSTMKFAGGSKTLSTTSNSIDVLTISYIGTTYYASLVKGYA